MLASREGNSKAAAGVPWGIVTLTEHFTASQYCFGKVFPV